MDLPIIDSFIREVNNLAGEPNSPSFDEELSSCLYVMANETNPVNLGYKFFMLNISLAVSKKILTYLSVLKLRSDSLRTPKGEPINQTTLSLALQAVIHAIDREEQPVPTALDAVRNRSNQSDSSSHSVSMETVSSGDEGTNHRDPNSLLVGAASGRSSRPTNSNKNSDSGGIKMSFGPRPGTSKHTNASKQKPTRSDDGVSDDSTPDKQSVKESLTRTTSYRTYSRRGRNSSASSASSATPSPFSFSPSCSPSSESHPEPPESPSNALTVPKTPLPSIEPMILSPGPPKYESSSSSLSSAAVSPSEPAIGLIVTFEIQVSIPIQQGLARVLSPYLDKIETTPICENHIFIKLKSKPDVYFLKRQIEILTQLKPRIAVSQFSRYKLDVPKPIAPTITEFVKSNPEVLNSKMYEFYVYSRPSTLEPNNMTTFEIFADANCQQAIESSRCHFKIGYETLKASPMDCFKECPRCSFCYDDAHTQCSLATLMSKG